MKPTKRTGPPDRYRIKEDARILQAEEARTEFQASAPVMASLEEIHLQFVLELRTRILNRIQAKGLKQKEMAIRMGTTESAVSRLLNDEVFNPTLETILKIEIALGEKLLLIHADPSNETAANRTGRVRKKSVA